MTTHKQEYKKNLRENMGLIHEIQQLRQKIKFAEVDAKKKPSKKRMEEDIGGMMARERYVQKEEIRKLMSEIDLLETRQKRPGSRGGKLDPIDKQYNI